MLRRNRVVGRLFIRALVGLAVLQMAGMACRSTPYQLPDPPPETEQQDTQQDSESQRNPDMEAREALLELSELLAEERFEEAEDRLSQQTRDFLAHGNDRGDASDALSAGQMTLPDGRNYRFEPAELLVAGDIARIEDSRDGADDHETSRRRVLYVIDSDGQAHRVVMIREGDQWVLHKTSVSPQNES
ncbi:MAG: hypothetical protein ACLFVJ_22340 [Persicimonas sp.]